MASISFPSSPSNGDTYSYDGLTYQYNSTKNKWSVVSTTTITGISPNAINQNLVPSANVTYDLGSTTNAFRDLYLSGSSINLGGATITANGNAITLPEGSKIGDEILTQKYLQVAFDGTLSLTTGTSRFTMPKAYTITDIEASLGTAADSAVLSTINKNGSAISTITIASGQTTASNTGLSISLAKDDYLTVDINSIGTTTKGSDLSITLTLE
jgi:hypothetical protein